MAGFPDSTDWIATSLPLFEPLEAALRCEVCKEFFENPVITTCSHTFCSLCIRRCITNDGKCPACKTPSQADKLVPNFVVREIVNRFQTARPSALELARQKKDEATTPEPKRKRKFEEADIEEAQYARQTRSRITRSSSRNGNGMADTPFEIPDSEDEGDAEFLPKGVVLCPICNIQMKEEQVWTHLSNGSCPAEQKSAGGRSTRSRANNTYSNPLQGHFKKAVPAPTRLPGLNYALLKDAALKKKLQDLGIATWGKKELLIRRHLEWLHLWNSNCDAPEDRRKSKRDLLKELDTWERTRGGHANTAEATVMRKDFDAKGHADTHRSQFDELIAAARKKAAAARNDKKDDTTNNEDKDGHIRTNESEKQHNEPALETEPQHATDASRPYEGNEAALASIREKVEETHLSGAILPPTNQEEPSVPEKSLESANPTQAGIPNPFGSPSRKLPMFSLPADPIVDVEKSAAIP